MKLLLILVWLTLAQSVLAHEGEDHGAPPPLPAQGLAPRASAATEAFEVVAVLEAKTLLLYLDHFATNAPISNAKVEIEGAGLKGFLQASGAGTYVLNVARAIPPGKHPLTITIDAADTADLLTATLEIPQPPAEISLPPWWGSGFLWGGIALLLFGTIWLARRSFRRQGR